MLQMFKELSLLFASPARLKLIKFFALQPNTRFTAVAVASTSGISRAVVDAELRALSRIGLISKRGSGKKLTYEYSASYLFGEEIAEFLRVMTLPEDRILSGAFRGISGISLVVATGVLVDDSRASVDLLVVSRHPEDTRITRAVRKIEAAAAMPLRYAILENREYQERLIAHDRLLRDVFEFSHRVVLGRA